MLLVDGERLTETAALHLWMARTFPDAKLMPDDAWGQAQAISLLSWVSGGIHPYLSRINAPPKVCDVGGTADNVIELATEYLYETFGMADEILDGSDYLMGDYGPDAYMFWAVGVTPSSSWTWNVSPTSQHISIECGRATASRSY